MALEKEAFGLSSIQQTFLYVPVFLSSVFKHVDTNGTYVDILLSACKLSALLFLTRFNKIAIQGTPQMALDKEAYRETTYEYYSKCYLPLFYV